MILLDTHILLWMVFEPHKLLPGHQALLSQHEFGDGLIKISSVSFWEIAVKQSKKKLRLPISTKDLFVRCNSVRGIEVLHTGALDWIGAAELEWDHKDPVDRLLVSMSIRNGWKLLTVDQGIDDYLARIS